MFATKRQSAPRCIERDGHTYVGVTSAMALVRGILGEEPEQYGPPALARMHRLEGTACHAACLDWLAYTFHWLPSYEPPAWPESHGDERRWWNVLSLAIKGFTEFVTQYEVEPIGIEQEAFSRAYGLVGHLDLYCFLKFRNGYRMKAVTDLKFVTSVQPSHLLQVRTYGRLEGFRDANVGLIYHGDRNTGHWRLHEVPLNMGLDDVAAVANAAKLWLWSEKKKGADPDTH